MSNSKPFLKLTVGDLQTHPVWEFDPNGRAVFPVCDLPVSFLKSRVVGTEARLANGDCVWVMMLNLSLSNPKMNPHLLTMRIEKDGRWFDLARYFDSAFHTEGPDQLAEFLTLPIESIFP